MRWSTTLESQGSAFIRKRPIGTLSFPLCVSCLPASVCYVLWRAVILLKPKLLSAEAAFADFT